MEKSTVDHAESLDGCICARGWHALPTGLAVMASGRPQDFCSMAIRR